MYFRREVLAVRRRERHKSTEEAIGVAIEMRHSDKTRSLGGGMKRFDQLLDVKGEEEGKVEQNSSPKHIDPTEIENTAEKKHRLCHGSAL